MQQLFGPVLEILQDIREIKKRSRVLGEIWEVFGTLYIGKTSVLGVEKWSFLEVTGDIVDPEISNGPEVWETL